MNSHHKPLFEKINNSFGSSFKVRRYADPCRDKTPYWHIHPEFELIYINGGNGKRHIGNHMSYFTNGDLLFIGANLPHFGFTDRLTGNQSESIIQMKDDFPGEAFWNIPEVRPIKGLFDRAKLGISFHGKTKDEVGKAIEGLLDLDYFDRFISLLNILNSLALSKEYSILNVNSVGLEIAVQENKRLSKVYSFVKEEFHRSITLEEVSDLANMSIPAFCRYFKKMSGRTFTQFVNEYRLIHASKLLAESSMSVANISNECGFNNFSHFSKLFKNYAGRSARSFRKENTLFLQ
ncbi:MAG: AraC family transcriptional regulator [Cyclobacteriaceae bacterium]|nr:AraC family transcriptional regulator [Cyclobacteriaceae bacterium]